MKEIPVKNAGNITVEVAFCFENQNGIFSLKPTSALLPPGDDIQLTVEFKPTTTMPPTPLDRPLLNHIYMNVRTGNIVRADKMIIDLFKQKRNFTFLRFD